MTTTTDKVLTAEYIADRWPRLFHVAEAGSWPSIQAHGLLSTSALLDLFGSAGRPVIGSRAGAAPSPSRSSTRFTGPR